MSDVGSAKTALKAFITGYTTVPDVEMKMSFVDLIVVYTDGTDDIFGTIYMGADDCYYLKLANSKVEGAAFKTPDSSFANGLF